MITGLVLIPIGLAISLLGATNFNVGTHLAGWCIAGAGAVIFLSHVVWLP